MEVRLPRPGEGADSGTVVQILVKEGDQVEKDQAILELENEKAVAPVPAPQGGTVEKIYVSEGQEIGVGDLILTLSEDEKPEKEQPSAKNGEGDAEGKEALDEQEQEEPKEKKEGLTLAKPGVPPPASPSVRKVAREVGIDLNRVRGSERGGRIVMSDLRSYVERLQKIVFEKERASAREAVPVLEFEKWGPVRREPLSGLRKAIGRKLVESWSSVPHVTQFDEADISALVALMKRYGPDYREKGARLTLTAFILHALVPLLREHPFFNASLDEEAEEIVFKEYVHIGIAVDTDQGLLVPVIRDADKKSMFDLSKELGQLADRARDRKLCGEEMRGATFTVSNQGGIGGGYFTPIINVPEVAILGIGRAKSMPAMRGDRIEPRVVLPLAVSYDHRVIDGGSAARFITALVEALENFDEREVQL